MILRYIVFAAIVIFCVFVMLVLVKDTGSERKKIEKQIKSTEAEKLRELLRKYGDKDLERRSRGF